MKKAARDERGVALVEFALVAPLILLLVIGVVEFGVFVSARSVISAASREGAHFLSLHPNSSRCDVETEVRKRVAPLDETTVTVSAAYYDSTNTRTTAPACPNMILPAPGTALQPYQVEVTVNYQFPGVFIIPSVGGCSFCPTFGGPPGPISLFTYTARAEVLH
jgi:Flp pilus assembly protein TadG